MAIPIVEVDLTALMVPTALPKKIQNLLAKATEIPEAQKIHFHPTRVSMESIQARIFPGKPPSE